MSLTGKDIAEIAKLLDSSHFSDLRLEMNGFKLRLRRSGGGSGYQDADEAQEPAPPAAMAPALPAAAPAPISTAPASGEVDVPAPLLGNFYAAPRPGDPPFVAVGDVVGPESAIGIIEVMKLMNSVRAGVAGTVTALLAQDGTAVEAGQPLIRVRLNG